MNRNYIVSTYSIRSCKGDTLISLMIASAITAIVALSMMLIMSINLKETSNAFNQTGNVSAANAALTKMGQVIRTASLLGDSSFSINSNNPNPGQAPTQSAGSTVSATFPSPSNTCYGANGTLLPLLANGWPWGGGPYTLGPDTLIVQIPILDKNANDPNDTSSFPWGPPVTPNPNPNNLPATPTQLFDTYVYKVFPDASREAGYYQLQLAIFPGVAPNTPAINNRVPVSNIPPGITPGVPTTILSGIIGPVDGNAHDAKISVFQFVNSSSNTPLPSFNPLPNTPTSLSNIYNGVVVNLQVINTTSSQQATVTTMRSEMFLHNNILGNIQ